MSISLFGLSETILLLGIRPAAIVIPIELKLHLEASKPECKSAVAELFAKLSAAQSANTNAANAYAVIDTISPEGFFVQALVPSTGEHILLEAVSDKFVKNWKQVVTPEGRAVLLALGFEEPGPRSPNYLLEIPQTDRAGTDLAARVASLVLSEVFGARGLSDAKVKLSLPGRKPSILKLAAFDPTWQRKTLSVERSPRSSGNSHGKLRYGYQEMDAVLFNDDEAWWFSGTAWEAMNLSDAHNKVKLLSKKEFDEMFADDHLPPLPKTAFKSGDKGTQ